MNYTIYALICLKNNRIYIGITSKDLTERFNQHLGSLRQNKCKNKLLQEDYNTFNLNKEDFIIIPLENAKCNTHQEMLDYENKWIKFYKKNYNRGIYNIHNVREIKEIPEEQKWSGIRTDMKDCIKIWEMIMEGMRNIDICNLLNVSNGLVSSIRNGKHKHCNNIEGFIPGLKPKIL